MRKKGLFGAITVAAFSILFGVQAFANPVDDAVAARLALDSTINSGIASVYNTQFNCAGEIGAADRNAIAAKAAMDQAQIAANNAAADAIKNSSFFIMDNFLFVITFLFFLICFVSPFSFCLLVRYVVNHLFRLFY